ncbi:MAG: metal ABC transporter permease [Bdellovibrionota bacterium]
MFLTEALSLPLFQRAVAAGLLVSVTCGIIGTYVVVKRMASISGGLSHAAFGGVGLGYMLGFSPMLGALGFCVGSAVILGMVYRHRKDSLDTLISIFWSLGMALGMLFIALTPGYAPDLSSYLFGSIVFVPENYLTFSFALDVAIVLVTVILFKEFQAVSFDEEFSEVSGIAVEAIFVFLLALTALAVVTLIRVAGVILTIALLTTPAVIARQWSESLQKMMVLSTLITAGSILSGLFSAYWLSERYSVDVPTGPLIIVLVTVLYGISTAARSATVRGRLE